MSLRKYQTMRDFTATPEPEGNTKKSTKKLVFVVQKHRASHLHYDFRLELDGVLKSWAVPKGPSLDPEDKRLAMMTEDHPYDYRKFEGIIPKGNYGAGEVIVWDEGYYEPKEHADTQQKKLKSQLHKGHLSFILHGEKLKGEFALVKNPKMGENAWLLVKKKDEYASGQDITRQNQSVITGETLKSDEARAENKTLDLTGAEKSDMLSDVKPMLATLTREPFNDDEWIFEIKWDGYRAIASNNNRTELYSRNGNSFIDKYTSLVNELKKLKHKAILDGEIVALDEDGKSRFEWLQNYNKKPRGNLVYYVFDLLWVDGHDTTGLPLLKRKELLKEIVPEKSNIIYSDHIIGSGKAFFATAEKQKLEGIMAKLAKSTYHQGKRSKSWLKVKTHLRQEAVICGFTEPRGSRKHIGALILGVYEDNELVYIGHTGGGLESAQMPELRGRLEKLERKTSPFKTTVKPNAPVHWVQPKLICEVTFSEWTSDGRMRQPILVGMRSDKAPEDIRKEMPKETREVKNKAETSKKPISRKPSKLKLSHLDKIFWPEAGLSKGDLVEYYRAVTSYILPYLKDRPESLLRHPNGYKGKSFFQKDVGDIRPKWVRTVPVYSESNQKEINYLVCDDEETLIYMVQLGCIEVNPWNSRVSALEKPDWVVMDLDPEDIPFSEVIKTAKAVRGVCEELNIPSYPKTSGKTGFHIYIPMGAKYTYGQAKNFAEIIANLVHNRLPEKTSLVRSPSKRQGKVYIDYLQNRKGQTLAAPYSARPTKYASVATPLDWSEVTDKLDPNIFTIKNTLNRLEQIGDIWKPVLGEGIDLSKVLKNIK